MEILVYEEKISEVVREGESHSIPLGTIRALITEFEEQEKRSPDNLAELIEVVLC